MAGNVYHALAIGHHGDASFGQLVLHRTDGNLVARNLTAGKKHHVAADKFEWVIFVGNARQGCARFALPARGQYQHFTTRKAHGAVEIDKLGQIFEIAVVLRHFDNSVERPSGNA